MTDNTEIRRLALVLTANACMFMFGVVLLLMGSLLPSLEVNYVEAGSLGSFPLAGILVATILVGPLLDTVGAKPVLAAGLAMVAGAVGLLPSLHTYAALALAALVYGFGGGVLNTATNALVADLLGVLNHPLVWLFGALLFFESGSENSMFVWAGKIVAGMFNATPERAGWALVGLSAAIGAGRLGATFLLRVLGNRRTMLLSAAVTVTGTMIAHNSRGFSTAVLGMVLIGLGLAPIYPTALGVAGDRFPRQTGTVFGAIMAVSLVGGTAGPSLCGTLAATGLRNILWVPMIAAVAVATLTILVTHDHPAGFPPD